MRFNRNTWLFLGGSLGVILLAVLVLSMQQPNGNNVAGAPTISARPLFAGANVTNIVSFTVKDEVAAAETVYAQQPDGSWGIESTTTGKNGPITQAAIDNAVATILNLQADQFASDKRVDFGLDTPNATIRFQTSAGDESQILLGNDAPDGTRRYALVNADAANVYLINGASQLNSIITLAGTPPIVLPPTPTPIPSLQLPGPLFNQFDPFSVGRIELVDNTREARLVLVRDITTNWVVEEATNAVAAPVDNSLVTVMLNAFGFLQGTAAITVSDLARVGLDTPAYTLTVVSENSTAAAGTGTTYRIDVGDADPSGALTYVRVEGYSEIATVLTRDLQILLDAIATPPYLIPAAGTAEANATVEATAEATSAP